jgi:Flp pilus assembly protein TadB
MWSSIFMSPFTVAVAGCLMILGLGCFGIYSEMDQKRIRSQERMTLLARGMSIEDIERLQRQVQNEDVTDPVRTMNNIRRTAMILFGSGSGILVFGLMLAAILANRVLLVVAAAGLIPVAIGVGFWIDYKMQARDLARFGLEADPQSPARK